MKKQIAYVLGEFPSLSETFIVNELIALSKRLSITTYALTKKRERVSQKPALSMLNNICYPPKKLLYDTGILRRWISGGINSFVYKAPLKNLPALFSLKRHYRNHFFLALWLSREIKRRGIAHLHAHFPEPSLVTMIASLLTGIPFSFTVHSHLVTEKSFCLADRVRTAKFVVAIGKDVRDDVLRIVGKRYRNKIYVIPCGIDCNYHQTITGTINVNENKSSQFHIMTIARLVRHKGIHILLAAFAKALKTYQNMFLTIVGDGPKKRNLMRLSKKLGVEKRVVFMGPVPHGRALFTRLSRSDLFVLPCITDTNGDQDGLPVAILEAMFYKVPIVSTRIASIPEAVTFRCGTLVEEESVEQLANVIATFYRMPRKERQKMGGEGKSIIEEKFNLNNTSQKLFELFTQSVLSQ